MCRLPAQNVEGPKRRRGIAASTAKARLHGNPFFQVDFYPERKWETAAEKMERFCDQIIAPRGELRVGTGQGITIAFSENDSIA